MKILSCWFFLLFAVSIQPAHAADLSLPVVLQCDEVGKVRYEGTLSIADKFEGERYQASVPMIANAISQMSLSFNGLLYVYTGAGESDYLTFSKKPCNLANFSRMNESGTAYEASSSFAAAFWVGKRTAGPGYVGKIGHCAFKTK